MRDKVKELFDVERKMHSLIVKKLSLIVKDSDLSIDQCQLLFILEHSSKNQKQIAQCLHISEATLSVRIRKLENNGYIIREVDTNDRRNYKIRLSDKAYTFMEQEKNIIGDYINSIFSEIDDNKLDDAINSFNMIINKLEGETNA